jgi:hypothetical protein
MDKTALNNISQEKLSTENYDEIIRNIFEQMENIQKSSYVGKINN